MPAPAEPGPPLPAAFPLQQLEPGQAARISRVVGQAECVHRLKEFGLCDGVRIEMFRPGNPCILRLAGNKICFRADERLDVLVIPVPTPD
jgi:Fe2+ transport system protein FeoA